MTNKFVSEVGIELAKAGILFLVMGICIYMLWAKMESYDKEVRKELIELKKETAICRNEYQRLLLEQVTKTTEVIERNTFVIQNLKK